VIPILLPIIIITPSIDLKLAPARNHACRIQPKPPRDPIAREMKMKMKSANSSLDRPTTTQAANTDFANPLQFLFPSPPPKNPPQPITTPTAETIQALAATTV
jgi:hypothetical protein